MSLFKKMLNILWLNIEFCKYFVFWTFLSNKTFNFWYQTWKLNMKLNTLITIFLPIDRRKIEWLHHHYFICFFFYYRFKSQSQSYNNITALINYSFAFYWFKIKYEQTKLSKTEKYLVFYCYFFIELNTDTHIILFASHCEKVKTV